MPTMLKLRNYSYRSPGPVSDCVSHGQLGVDAEEDAREDGVLQDIRFGLRRAFRSPNEILPSFTSHNLPSGAAKPRYHTGNVACRWRALIGWKVITLL